MRQVLILFLNAIMVILLAYGKVNAQSSSDKFREISWSSNGDNIAAARQDGIIEIRSSNGQFLRSWQGDSSGATTSIAWQPILNSSLLLSGGKDMAVRLWDANTGNLIHEFVGHSSIITSVFWSPDGTMIGSTSYEDSPSNNIRVWDFQTHNLLFDDKATNINHANWSSDGTKLAIASGASIRLWDVNTGQFLNPLTGHPGEVVFVDWNPSSNILASTSLDSTIRIWDVNSGAVLQVLPGHDDSAATVKWSPDGNYLATTGYDSTIRIWDVSTGNLIETIQDISNGLPKIAWNPDGSQIVYGSENGGTVTIIPAPGFILTCDHDIPASDTATLISTITTANGSGNPTTICLADDSTYTLTTENNILNGLPIITGDITIEGNNATITRDVNAPDFHFFEVVTGAKLTLNDLTLSNGDVSGDSERGGALMNDGGETTLNNVTFDGNAAGTGGAIDNEDGLVTINDSTFTNNVAAYGGAIDNDPTATTIITGSTFTTNHADFNGGAIHNDGGTLTVSSTAFTTNTADDYGGGIDNDEGDVTINASTFTSNSSDGGGAIRNDGTLTINAGSAFNTNAANNLGWGGAIYNKSGTTLIINASSFDGNTANLEGGAIRNQGDLTVNTGSSFDGNSAVEYGGAIYNTGGTVDLTGVQITNNTATSKDAGGVYVNSSGSLTITDSTLDGNDSGRRGGGIWSGGSASLTNVHITNNTAVVEGGGVYGSSGATISAGNSCISGNSSRAVYSPSSTAQNFENNWWGATNGPSGSGSGSGDAVNSNIDYDPFITTSCPLP